MQSQFQFSMEILFFKLKTNIYIKILELFQVPMEGLEVSKLIVLLNSRKNELMICDWGISQSNLEDVFMRIVESGGNEKKLEEFTNSNEI